MKRILMFMAMAMLLASCSSNGKAGGGAASDAGPTVKLRTEGDAQVFPSPYWTEKGKVWIPAERAADLLNYRYVLNSGSRSAAMGFSDPMYLFAADSKQAAIGDDRVLLNEAPRMKGQSLYVELGSLSQLLQTPVTWNDKNKTVVVGPPKNMDPVRTPAAGTPGMPFKAQAVDSDDSGNAKADKIIAFAKRYMNTPYKFDADPYAQSRAFDCSSFMQHVFGQFGIDLPRSSKSQSTVGTYVTRANLRKGDLVFFHTPGRYSSNDIVGHVGLYIGGNRVIQTYGDPGVTVTLLAGSWDERILWGRRVL